MVSVRNSLLKADPPIPKPIYTIHSPTGLTQLARLMRLGLSHLNKHTFNHKFADCVKPLWSCGVEIV